MNEKQFSIETIVKLLLQLTEQDLARLEEFIKEFYF